MKTSVASIAVGRALTCDLASETVGALVNHARLLEFHFESLSARDRARARDRLDEIGRILNGNGGQR